MAVFTLFLIALTTYLATYIYSIFSNYLIARRINLPIVISPFEPYSITTGIASGILTPIFKKLPFKTGTWWCRIINISWLWASDFEIHKELGINVVMVTPGRCVLLSADPVLIADVMKRSKEFVKPAVYEHMECFGPNVDTLNGQDWDRHRKLTAPCFNERVSSFVWDESIRQARSMLSIWLDSPDSKVSNMVEDTRVIALHVLSAAGFGISHDFSGGARLPAEGHKMSHKDALMTLLDNLITMVILTQMQWLEKISVVLPAKIIKILAAIKEFGQYMDEMLAHERKIIAHDSSSLKANLLSTLIRTSDEAKADGLGSGNVRLSDEEIKGNLFIFNMAGHDTTANTLAYATAMLATHPEYQDWAVEELDRVIGEKGDGEELIYEEIFPKLKRTLAIMYETLRLYGQVPMIPRAILNPNTSVSISSSSFSPGSTLILSLPLPTTKNFEISMNLHACDTSPTTFIDPAVFNPKRWITVSESGEEKFTRPETGCWPWLGGPRMCPGMRFSQVEFVGVMSTVLRGARLAPSVKGDREAGFEEAKREVMSVVRDSGVLGATLKMSRPEDLFIKVTPRA